MPTFALLLALSLGPGKALTPPRAVAPRATIHLDVGVLAPVDAAIPEVQTLGALLSDGVVLGELHLGVEGQPSMPFLNPFFYSQEIRSPSILAGGQIDALALAGQLMFTARVEL